MVKKSDDMDTENVKNCSLNITMKTLTAMKTTLKAGSCARRCFPVPNNEYGAGKTTNR